MEKESEELSVRQVLENTYSRLTERHKNNELFLPDSALAVVANDSDFHSDADVLRMHKNTTDKLFMGRRQSYMRYERAVLLEIYGRNWMIARGEACGGYLSDLYDGDIIALEIDTDEKVFGQITEELVEAIREHGFFENSLVTALGDGLILLNDCDDTYGLRKGKFGRKLFELIKDGMLEFVVKGPSTVYHSVWESVHFPVVLMQGYEEAKRVYSEFKRPVRYKPEFADFLADSIEAVFK